MPSLELTRHIDAPPELVFRTVSQIDEFSKAVPAIEKVEFLSDIKHGVGARFVETRNHNGRTATAKLEVTGYQENELVRIESEEGGTHWDSTFTVTADGEGSRLLLHMIATPRKLLARLMTPLIMGFIRKAMESDMDSVKEFCESSAA